MKLKLPRFAFFTHIFEPNRNGETSDVQQTQKISIKEKLRNFSLSPCFKQNLAATGPLLLTVTMGMTMGYSAVLLPQLQTDQNELAVSKDQESWVASMAALPMAFGAILGGLLSEKFGRKTTHILTCLPLFIGWLIIYLALNIDMLLAGRFLTGLCAGILSSATGVYIGEISQPSQRGILLGAIALSISIGLFLVHLLGTFLHWRTTASISSTLPLLSWAFLLLAPESPSWLVKKGWLEKAEDSFFWFRGVNSESREELDTMLKIQAENSDNPVKQNMKEAIKSIFVPELLKPMGFLVVLMMCSQGTGINAVNFYSVILIKNAVPGVNSYTSTLSLDVIRVFSSFLGCVFIRKFGRRPLLMYAGVSASFTLLVLSLYSFSSMFLPQVTASLYIIPLISLVLYTFFIAIGFGAVPWALVGELFPLNNRSIGSGVASFSAFMSMFVVVKTMPYLFESIGVHGTFLIYSVSGLVGVVASYFCLPETRGKTLNQIEEFYLSKKEKNSEGLAEQSV